MNTVQCIDACIKLQGSHAPKPNQANMFFLPRHLSVFKLGIVHSISLCVVVCRLPLPPQAYNNPFWRMFLLLFCNFCIFEWGSQLTILWANVFFLLSSLHSFSFVGGVFNFSFSKMHLAFDVCTFYELTELNCNMLNLAFWHKNSYYANNCY